jgi:membrane-associated phospholipid phosphatase
MVQRLKFFFIFLSSVTSILSGTENGPDRAKSIGLFDNLRGNAGKSFTGSNAWLQAAGVAATALLIYSDADYRVHAYFRNHRATAAKFHPVVVTGSLLTPLTGAVCYLSGAAGSDRELTGLGSAILQTQVITSLTVGVLKGFTGRPHPDPRSGADMRRLSRTFRFGFLRGGLFWGWPSGHTASTMALVSTLTAYYPEKTWLKVGGAALMGYTIIGVSAVGGGRMHWFSDAVAAAFMTYAIGHTVGNHYHQRIFHEETAFSKPGRIQMAAESMSTYPIIRIYYSF